MSTQVVSIPFAAARIVSLLVCRVAFIPKAPILLRHECATQNYRNGSCLPPYPSLIRHLFPVRTMMHIFLYEQLIFRKLRRRTATSNQRDLVVRTLEIRSAGISVRIHCNLEES
jgi:hypothetical protein